MEISKFFEIIESEGHKLNESQRNVIKHGDGPLWVIAGPGSGKTQVLVLRTLKLIFVDNVKPKSIILTTFTEKAAKNLFDRILNFASKIIDECNVYKDIDVHEIYIGTLHSLCSEILLENNSPNYENYRLIDDIEKNLFVKEQCDIVKNNNEKYLDVFKHFNYLFKGYDPITGYSFGNQMDKVPNVFRITKGIIPIFDRIVEDEIDIDKMKQEGNHFELLADAYQDYYDKLEYHKRCDFSHLQKKFLEFLGSNLGQSFLDGEGKNKEGIQYVLVDEYQDTNPLQEAIYLKLTEKNTNLCVVGDDDQSLYRFRGGTVDCMVTFKEVCEYNFNIDFSDDSIIFLDKNYRSHESIVNYYNEYINSFESMNLKNARVDEKPLLKSKSSISGDYPAVAYINEKGNIKDTAKKFAYIVKSFLELELIKFPSQCALLMRSTKEPNDLVDSLNELGIETYNPRSKSYLKNEEISWILGAFFKIIDPELSALSSVGPRNIKKNVEEWVDSYLEISENTEIVDYVNKSIKSINSKKSESKLDINILDIFYRIISKEPIKSCKDDFEKNLRIGKLSKIFESFSSTPLFDYHGVDRGKLKMSSENDGEISFKIRRNIYYSLVYLLISNTLDDPENEDSIIPPNKLPVFTIHQAKGLEFQIVFVYPLKLKKSEDASILLEDDLIKFRKKKPYVEFTPAQKQEQDNVRLFYVAYSRAEHILIHVIPDAHFKDEEALGLIYKSKIKFEEKVEKI